MTSSVIKQEIIDCGTINTTSIDSNTHFSVPHGANDVISININTNSNQKMGSRRIFTPQFKLQVLESYRNDTDCKGNQRATARKYNIHRRQIQKWLQCESNLRSSVANINQSNMKHQFHNINHDHHQPQKQNMAITSRSKHFNYSQINNQHPLHHHLSSDAVGQRITLNSPSKSTFVLEKSSLSTKEGAAMANLAPVIENSAASMSLASTQSSPSKSTKVSLVRPTAIGGSNGTILKSMLHTYHHYDQYTMPYTHTPASIPVSVPTITHNSPPHLLNHYQYQNLTHHSNSLTHEQQSSLYLPSTSLPVIVMSAATPSVTTAKYEVEHLKATAIENEEIRKYNQFSALKSAAPTVLTQATGNSDEYMHKSCDYIKIIDSKNVNKTDEKCELIKQTLSLLPMDLSLGQRDKIVENVTSVKSSDHSYESYPIDALQSKPDGKNDIVVDLTFRKRKVISNFVVQKQIEKKAKSSDSENFFSSHKIDEVRDEKQKDVGNGVEPKNSASKPIKLFKPYLLDTEDDIKIKPTQEQCNHIVWNHHSDCMCPHNYNSCEHSLQSSLHTPPLEKDSFCAENFNIDNNKINFNQCSPSPQFLSSQLSPEGLRCPKGSPVSGYESSSSTYSDLSSNGESKKNSSTKAYSIDVQMQPLFKNNLILNESNVKKWLDQEYIYPPRSPSSSIALYI